MKKKVYALIIYAVAFQFCLVSCKGNDWRRNESVAQLPDAMAPFWDEDKYMTEEEIIEVFYSNYDTFSKVAEYLLQKEELSGIGISPDGNKIIIFSNDSGITEVETTSVEVGDQIKLICSLGFEGAGRDQDSTRVYFSIRYFDPPPYVGLPGSRGVVYVPGTLEDARPQDKLERDNWYYFFLSFD